MQALLVFGMRTSDNSDHSTRGQQHRGTCFAPALVVLSEKGFSLDNNWSAILRQTALRGSLAIGTDPLTSILGRARGVGTMLRCLPRA